LKVIGKTNLTELCGFNQRRDGEDMWASSVGGSVHSAWVEGGVTLGSSSGAPVSVAAGYCPIAIGTDTFGSAVSLLFFYQFSP
jgi:amidase